MAAMILRNSSSSSHLFLMILVVSLLLVANNVVEGAPNYRDALAKSILFFEGQRSGKISSAVQHITWRSNSALYDGQLSHVCLLYTQQLCFLFFVSCHQTMFLTYMRLILDSDLYNNHSK